jgi:hypothetical protein
MSESIKVIFEIPAAQAQLFVDQIAGLVAASARDVMEKAVGGEEPIPEEKAVELLKCSKKTLSRYRIAGLRSTKIGKKIWYTMNDIIEFQKSYSGRRKAFGK